MGNSSRPIEVILHLGFEPPIRNMRDDRFKQIHSSYSVYVVIITIFSNKTAFKNKNSKSCWNFTLSSSKNKQQGFLNFSTRYQLSNNFNSNNTWKSTWVFYKEGPKKQFVFVFVFV